MPAFGRPMLAQWKLDPAYTYLNHGTVGAPPRVVLEAQQRIRDEAEAHPAQYLLRELNGLDGWPVELTPRMRLAAAPVAAFLGARADDTVFVENVTAGCNAVLRSLTLQLGDEILVTDRAYGAVVNAAQYVARRAGATVKTVEIPYPTTGPQQIADTVMDGVTAATRLVFVDHIAAESALLFPVAEIARRCRERGIAVLIDGAHAPGAIALDIPAIGADWYAANLHKWCMAPRSAGILWAPPERQHDLHPPSVSWGLDLGFTREFDWVGTFDPSRFLAAPDGVAFIQSFGDGVVFAANHALAWAGAQHLATRWETTLGVPEECVGTMVTVPLPARAGTTRDDAMRLRAALYYDDKIEIQMHAWRGQLWVRLSAQIYNDLDDVERLASAVLARI